MSSFLSKHLPFTNIPEEKNDIEVGEQSSLLGKIKNTVQLTIEVEINYRYFFLVFGTGLFFILISFIYLPLVILYPYKFSSFFSFGTLIILFSFIFIYGTVGFLNVLFKKERILFTLLYISSIVGGFIFTYMYNNFIIGFVCACIQITFLVLFALTFIPGGQTGISLIIHALKLPFQSLLKLNNLIK